MRNFLLVLSLCLPPCICSPVGPSTCAARVDPRPPGCSSCPAGSYAPAQSTAATACLCNAGFEGAPGELCVSTQTCASRVDPRPPGCSSCPADSYAPAQSTAATACLCNAGFEAGAGGACEATLTCPSNSLKTADGSACVCNAGFFSPSSLSSFGDHFNDDWSTYARSTGAEFMSGPARMSWTLPSLFQEFEIVFVNTNSIGRIELTLNGVLLATGPPRTENELFPQRIRRAYTAGHELWLAVYGSASIDNGQLVFNLFSSTCHPCPENTYKEAEGNAVQSCLPCKSFSESEAASINQVSCLCVQGYEGAPGDTCAQCAAGKFKSEAGGGADSCQDVPLNSFSADRINFLCDAGFYSSFVSNFNVQPLTQENWFAYAYTTGASFSDPADPPPSWMRWTLPHTFQEFEVEFANGLYAGTLELTLNGVLLATGYPRDTIVLYPQRVRRAYSGGDVLTITQLDGGGLGMDILVFNLFSTTCHACPENTHKEAEGNAVQSCLPCKSFSVSEAASINQVSCLCVQGYGIAGVETDSCQLCGQGEYKPTVANTVCVSCPTGTSSEDAGRFDVTQCLASPGFTRTAADGAPLASVRPCDAGTYKPDLGDHACAPCPALLGPRRHVPGGVLLCGPGVPRGRRLLRLRAGLFLCKCVGDLRAVPRRLVLPGHADGRRARDDGGAAVSGRLQLAAGQHLGGRLRVCTGPPRRRLRPVSCGHVQGCGRAAGVHTLRAELDVASRQHVRRGLRMH